MYQAALGSSHPTSPCSAVLDYIKSLPKREIEELNEDPNKLESFLSSFPAFRQWERAREEIRNRIEYQAAVNMEKEPVLTSAYATLQETASEVADTRAECEQLLQKHQALAEKYAPHAIKRSHLLRAKEEKLGSQLQALGNLY
ncbi:unnamed protein product [Cyprideis torosa]|uniref:Uncharacterized protein n=1 Tax=Cyprideis torosa TaxID=163714 RepID=A0A7R8WBQ1_9CRUS|nr:unnamed protein product [Cyprideis torosa]CAG0886582.1 unnamed protein product [Cyprideis torosa]